MSLFQKSVINTFLKKLDNEQVSKSYLQFKKFYSNKLRLLDILRLKEENYQEGFLREIFVQALGYTIRPDLDYNLTTEYKNQTDSRKADGAILRNATAIAVIELKSAKTFKMESIKEQAFSYKNNQPNCRYVITSNFRYLRFYIDNSTEYQEFDLFELKEADFKVLYLILSKDSIFNDIPLKMKEETKFVEESITDKFYRDYKHFKDAIFENLIQNNPKHDKLTLFKKSQKLLDRLLFIYFAEDSGLLPPNTVATTVEQWKTLVKFDAYTPLYSRFQKLFSYLDTGKQFDTYEYPAYNGGLFKPDEFLDNPKLKIDDKVLVDDCLKLSKYDFDTDIDINILGHIFEHSLNEIEEIEKNIQGLHNFEGLGKRKKDGIFYTPKYITDYIIDNTIGKLCREKQAELNLQNLEGLKIYKDWLLTLKILDPACGSGAFLNAALDFLIKEHQQIADSISELSGEKTELLDTDKSILENNIFGVDINEESVDIAKLSLWLRTAKRNRKLSDLSKNIKCGNSLIDEVEIAGEKAFNWNKEFAAIMKKGGFDVVIGNPPYGAEMSKQQTNFLDSKFTEHKSGTKNSAIYFIYQANLLTKKGGMYSFIIPKSLCYSNGWGACAKFLVPNLTKLIDTGKAFEEVLLEQVIFIEDKKSNTTTYKTGICEKDSVKELENIDKRIFHNFGVLIAGNPLSELAVIDKITKFENKYQDFVSIERGLNWQSKAQKNEGTTPIYRGSQLDRYYLNQATEFIDLQAFNESDYTYQMRPKLLNQLAIAHVLNPYPHFYLQSFLDTENRLVFETISCTFPKFETIDMNFLLAFNNSKLFAWILYKFVYSNAIRSTRFDEKYVGKIPVPNFLEIDTHEIAENAKVLTVYQAQINAKQEEFIQILVANLKLEKVTEKLQTFYNYTFDVFLEELKKQKKGLELNKQKQWLDFFNEYKKEINAIQKLQSKIDSKTNQLIYELYQLSSQEIAIIENTTP